MRIVIAALLLMTIVLSSCIGDDHDGSTPASPTDEPVDPVVRSIAADLGIQLHPSSGAIEVSLCGMPSDIRRAADVEFAGQHATSEGNVGMLDPGIVPVDWPYRDLARRPLGDWEVAYVADESGQLRAYQSGYPVVDAVEDGVGGLWLQSVSRMTCDGESVIAAPTETVDMGSIRYFPPEAVDVRGVRGLLLVSQPLTEAVAARAVNYLVWAEDGCLWLLAARADEFPREWVVETADHFLAEYDRVADTWVVPELGP